MIYRLTFASEHSIAGRIELAIPATGPARYEAVFSGPDVGTGFLVVRDHEVPRPRGTVIELRADGLWTEWTCETREEHWSFGLEAFGLRVEDPGAEIGDRVPVGYDLEWETPDHVHGEVLIGRDHLSVAAVGSFVVAD
ncbi:MAG: hypothetical protein JJE46_03190 [Acidimicrobiia bacterium]|nr:hypothetical protein [Acidimicrobiia bacterium]